jgi:hypothetical protein
MGISLTSSRADKEEAGVQSSHHTEVREDSDDGVGDDISTVSNVLHHQSLSTLTILPLSKPSDKPGVEDGGENGVASVELTISELLGRDATEHYFFIREVLRLASLTWSPVLTGLFVLAVYVVVAYSAFLLLLQGRIDGRASIQIAVLIVMRIVFLVLYPIVSICHANSQVYEMRNYFASSSPEDYQCIGGRNRWMEFMEASPIAWTYYGIWVTWDKLVGVLWTTFAGVVAYVVTSLAGLLE